MKEEYRKKIEASLNSEDSSNSNSIKEKTWAKLDINQPKKKLWRLIAAAIILFLVLSGVMYIINNTYVKYEQKILILEKQIASINEQNQSHEITYQNKIDTLYLPSEVKMILPDTIFSKMEIIKQQTDTVIINHFAKPEIITIQVRDTIYIEKKEIPIPIQASVSTESEKPSSIQFIFNDKESILKRRKSNL